MTVIVVQESQPRYDQELLIGRDIHAVEHGEARSARGDRQARLSSVSAETAATVMPSFSNDARHSSILVR